MSDKSNKGHSELREKSKVSPIHKGKKPAIGLQGHTSKGGTPFIDAHNHLVGRYGSYSGVQEIDYKGAARVALDAMNRLGIKKMSIMPPFPPHHRIDIRLKKRLI